MRIVSNVTSLVGKARRGVTQAASVDVSSPERLAETVRQLGLRLNKLEAAAGPEATEFEVNLPTNGTTVELAHQAGGPVRWSVVGWYCVPSGVSPSEAPRLVYDSSSTNDVLILRSYVKGRAIIRVEPTQGYVDPGPTLDVTQGIPLGRQQFKGAFSSTTAVTLITIPVPDNSVCTWRVCVIGQNTTTLASRAIYSWTMHARRQLAAGVIDLVLVNDLATATAGYSATATVSGNDIIVTGTCTVPGPQPLTWTAIVEPLNIYLRDEP